LEGLVDDLTPSLAASNPLLGILISNVLLGLAAGISIAVPYVGLFYLFLAFLEDTGLLARFIIALNRLMGHLRLPGKAIIPLLLGLGCTVPALRSTRILSGYGDRLKVALLYLAVPCSSRTAIIMGVVGHYGGLIWALAIYLLSGMLFVITAKAIGRLSPDPLSLIEEMPPIAGPWQPIWP